LRLAKSGNLVMRLVALMILACVAACAGLSDQSQQASLVRYDHDWRQHQATLDAQAIMQGMAQEKSRQEEVARISR
jgi:hypothetical protein